MLALSDSKIMHIVKCPCGTLVTMVVGKETELSIIILDVYIYS